MRIYHAGPGRDSAVLYEEACVRRVLLSFSDVGNAAFRFWIEGAPKGADVFMDSGAFSAWTSGRPIDLSAYCDWIGHHGARVSAYASLDVIGDWRASARNLDAMLARGLSPVPTFHRGSPLEELGRLASEHRHLAIGGMMSHGGQKVHRQTRESLMPFLDSAWNVLRRYWPVKVHLFGSAAHQWILERYPIYSADSATVKIGASLGAFASFERGRVRWKYWWDDIPSFPAGALGEVGALGDVCVASKALARTARWRKSAETLAILERYVTDLWAQRGVRWDDGSAA